MDGSPTSDIDHTTTLRANILRDSLNQSQTKSPMKPRPVSPVPQPSQTQPPFLHSLCSWRGLSMPSQPPKDMEDQGEEVNKTEDIVSMKTQESSVADAEVGILPILIF